MKKLFGLLATASLVAGGALVAMGGPAGAGNGSFGQLVIDVEKQVVGTQPSGDFEVEVDCDLDGPGEYTIEPDEFDLNGDGDSEDVVVEWDYDNGVVDITCTVEETEDLGATSVVYECDSNDDGVECDEDESEDPAEITVDISEVQICSAGFCVDVEADVTIINTFEAATTTTVAPATAPPTSAAAAAVAARARFTG